MDRFYLYIFCGISHHFNKRVDGCMVNGWNDDEEELFSVSSPFKHQQTMASCSDIDKYDEQTPERLKLEFICLNRLIFMTTFQLVLVLVTVVLCGVNCAFAGYLHFKNIPVFSSGDEDEMHVAQLQHLQQMENDRKMEKIKALVESKHYARLKSLGGEVADSCCICVEPFANDMLVKRTPCQHLFHSKCLF